MKSSRCPVDLSNETELIWRTSEILLACNTMGPIHCGQKLGYVATLKVQGAETSSIEIKDRRPSLFEAGGTLVILLVPPFWIQQLQIEESGPKLTGGLLTAGTRWRIFVRSRRRRRHSVAVEEKNKKKKSKERRG